MDRLLNDGFPWGLVSALLLDILSVEEKSQLEQWLSMSTHYLEKCNKLQQIWKNGLDGYADYQLANEERAWEALQVKFLIPQSF